jgi:hypothetical protein
VPTNQIQRREFIMATLTDREENTTTETEVGRGQSEHPDRGHRTLKALVIVLAVALVGLGGWVIIDRSSTSDTAPSDDVAQLWDDYSDAWNNYDSEAFLGLVTSDYTFVSEQGTNSAADQAVEITRLGSYGWHVTPVGDAAMAGDGPWYVTQVNEVEFSTGTAPVEGISVMTIVDDGGVLRISNHTFFGDL